MPDLDYSPPVADFSPSFDALFARLETSPFRRRFRLSPADRAYVREKGVDAIRRHAEDFVRGRLAPAAQRRYIADVLMAWIARQMEAAPPGEAAPSPAASTSARRARARKSPGDETPGLPFLS